jgi:hypothetical protein
MNTQTQIDCQPGQRTQRRRCSADCADGTPCEAWAVHGTDQPRCAPHGGGRAPVGAPLGNQNARAHGFYANTPSLGSSHDGRIIDSIIADLHCKQWRLSRYIDEHMDDLPPADLARFLRIHAQGSSRLGRLLRDREVLTGGWNEAIDEIIEQTLAELGEAWGVELV